MINYIRLKTEELIKELYENYSTLPVLLLHQQNSILFAHNMLHCPYKLQDLFRHYLNKMMILLHIIPDLRTVFICIDQILIRYKSILKYRAAKYYNNLPEGIRSELGDSGRYNKSVLRNYLLKIKN